MNDPIDLLIVGGGAIGLCSAWRAAQRGLRVRVLERDRPGAGASTAAAGLLSPGEAHEWAGGHGAFNLAAMLGWEDFAAELEEFAGMSLEYRPDGALRLAYTEADVAALAMIHDVLAGIEIEHDLLDADGCRAEEPGVRGAVAGLLSPRDAHVHTERLIEALARACTRAGVELSVGVTPVSTLAGSGDGVAGVRLSDGTEQPAALTVLAAGAWSSQVAWLPEDLRPPVRPLLGEYVILRGDPDAPVARRVLRGSGGTAAPRAEGRFWVGTTVREAGYPSHPSAASVADILARWTAILPGLADLGFERAGSGLRPGTPDRMPIVGPSPVDGLGYATGHGREGIIHTPLTGAAVAGLAAGDPMPDLMVPFAPDRPL